MQRGRVALLCATSTLPMFRAPDQEARFSRARPGVSTLRRKTVHCVPHDFFEALKKANRELGSRRMLKPWRVSASPAGTGPSTRQHREILEREFRLGEDFAPRPRSTRRTWTA
jgi:hypothetical protein